MSEPLQLPDDSEKPRDAWGLIEKHAQALEKRVGLTGIVYGQNPEKKP